MMKKDLIESRIPILRKKQGHCCFAMPLKRRTKYRVRSHQESKLVSFFLLLFGDEDQCSLSPFLSIKSETLKE